MVLPVNVVLLMGFFCDRDFIFFLLFEFHILIFQIPMKSRPPSIFIFCISTSSFLLLLLVILYCFINNINYKNTRRGQINFPHSLHIRIVQFPRIVANWTPLESISLYNPLISSKKEDWEYIQILIRLCRSHLPFL